MTPKLTPNMTRTLPPPHETQMILVIDENKFYIGSTINFKKRYNSHKHSFRHADHKNSTTLSNYIWDKELGTDPNLKWEIIRHSSEYRKGGKQCDLCLTEKLLIL